MSFDIRSTKSFQCKFCNLSNRNYDLIYFYTVATGCKSSVAWWLVPYFCHFLIIESFSNHFETWIIFRSAVYSVIVHDHFQEVCQCKNNAIYDECWHLSSLSSHLQFILLFSFSFWRNYLSQNYINQSLFALFKCFFLAISYNRLQACEIIISFFGYDELFSCLTKIFVVMKLLMSISWVICRYISVILLILSSFQLQYTDPENMKNQCVSQNVFSWPISHDGKWISLERYYPQNHFFEIEFSKQTSYAFCNWYKTATKTFIV